MSSPIGSSQGSTYPATSRRWSVLLVWWATCVLWSSVFLFIKMGVTAVPPLGFAALRLALAAGILVLFTLVRRQPWPTEPRDWMLISSTGVLLLGLNYGLLFWGTQFIPSGVTAVLQASSPAFSLVLAGLLGAERMTLAKVGGVTLGIAGVAIVCLDQGRLSGAWSLVGSVAVTAGAICVAIAYVGVKTYRRALNSTMLMAGQMISALVPLGIAALIKEGNPLAFNWTGTAIVSLLYLALAGSIVADGCDQPARDGLRRAFHRGAAWGRLPGRTDHPANDRRRPGRHGECLARAAARITQNRSVYARRAVIR
jgi:drug/metabolite transporter (DMT)-like permease